MNTAIGYLRYRRQFGCWFLCVPCPSCDMWHEHGASDDGTPLYQPGEVTYRAPHCQDEDAYGPIVVMAEPFKQNWSTALRRKSKAWQAYEAQQFQRNRDMQQFYTNRGRSR